MAVTGWDIGGVNLKCARVSEGVVLDVRQRPFELQRAPEALVRHLCELAGEIGATPADAHGVTMTAELSQMFRTKRDGVRFVLDAVEAAFPRSEVRVFRVDGRFVTPEAARKEPLPVAAANWAATAHVVAPHHPDALLVDVGTTTTDIIPIVGGRVAARGRTDPERLGSGELVYTGALRTPAEAIASHVPVGGIPTGVSTEGFALAGDVHLWRGALEACDYTVPTPDGRPATREFAAERLARVVCGDRELLDDDAVDGIAEALARAQVDRIASAMAQVRDRHASIHTVIVTGLGAFLGAAAARALDLEVVALSAVFGGAASRCAPATAVGLLLQRQRAPGGSVVRVADPGGLARRTPRPAAPVGHVLASPLIDVVVKVGGGLLSDVSAFEGVLASLDASRARVLVVPGGGPFADAVRRVDERLAVGNDAAHWMAILAMDQYAHFLATRLRRGAVVEDVIGMAAVLARGGVPVLAPYRWLRAADPLPHTWDVTSDSIGAWVAGAVGAPRLVAVKPPGAAGPRLVDAYFTHALPPGVTVSCVAADQVEALSLSLAAAFAAGS
jgi:hypothetical protein